MYVDPSKSAYREDPAASSRLDPDELEHLRIGLNRLQFLEQSLRTMREAQSPPIQKIVFFEKEEAFLRFVLDDFGFLSVVAPA